MIVDGNLQIKYSGFVSTPRYTLQTRAEVCGNSGVKVVRQSLFKTWDGKMNVTRELNVIKPHVPRFSSKTRTRRQPSQGRLHW
jgi:hypothetical protein